MEDYHGHCYCNKIEFTVKRDTIPSISVYCHCDSCRRAHSAPMYHVIYIPKEDFLITKGTEYVSVYTKTINRVTRNFCSNCGSRIYNVDSDGVGFFPNLLDEEIQKNLPEKFKSTLHHLTAEAVLNVDQIADGIRRK